MPLAPRHNTTTDRLVRVPDLLDRPLSGLNPQAEHVCPNFNSRFLSEV